MDWTIKSYAEANHPPVPKLGHPVELTAKPGDRVDLSAEGSFDPDGDQLSYHWFYYDEAGTFTTALIMRSFFSNLPDGIEESAKIDGCNDFGILFRIVIPLLMPAITTISLFYAVTYWNNFFSAIMYLNDASKWPIQVLLRQIVIMASGLAADTSGMDDFVKPPEQTIKWQLSLSRRYRPYRVSVPAKVIYQRRIGWFG